MGSLFGGAPKAADPATVANTQQKYNTEAAQTNFKMQGQAANKTGPFGSTTTQLDANGLPIGQTQTLDPSLNSGTAADKFGATVNNLGTGQFNWDSLTPEKIAQGNMDAYGAMTAPLRAQQQNAMKTTLAERGIPLGSEIEQNLQGNMDRQFAAADVSAAAQAWNAVPGMQAQLTQNQITQEMAPGQVARQNLGLLAGMTGLSPGYSNLTPQAIAPGNFAQAQANYDNQEMQNYQNKWKDIGTLASVGMGGLFSPLPSNWSFGNTLAGKATSGLGGLFNGTGNDVGYGR